MFKFKRLHIYGEFENDFVGKLIPEYGKVINASHNFIEFNVDSKLN